MRNQALLASTLLTIATACSGTTTSVQSGSGGVTGALGSGGGTASSGGTSSAAPGTERTSGGGGVTGGGMSSTASGSDNGGNPAVAGSSAMGGDVATGGAMNTGGQPSTGGASATGGSVSTGGKPATGGVAAGGGKSGGGGISVTGGVAATGGTRSTGGNSNPSTGGESSASGGSSSTSATGCTREMLQTAVDTYMAAIQEGDSSAVASASYKENGTTVALGSGLWATPLVIDLLPPLAALDVEKCEAYVEVIVNNNHEYVFGSRLTVTAATGRLSAISVIVTDCDDWGFNAATYLQYSKAEQQSAGWGDVAAADRLSRAELHDAGFAYFAYWNDTSVDVPWGTPCSRLEGGMYTGTNGSCSVGIPTGTRVTPNDYLVDVERNMVVLFLGLPGPDSHWFRVNKTGMRYIHTLTVCYLNGQWSCPGTQPTCD